MGSETPSEVFEYLDKLAVKSSAAALICAGSYLFRPEPVPGHRMKLLKKAARSRDDEVSGSAYLAIGIENLTAGEQPAKTVNALKRAIELGNYDSSLVLAQAYESGELGPRNCLENAFNSLADAVDDDFGPAKLALALFSFRNGIHDEEYCPGNLLEEAAEQGVPGAEEILIRFRQVQAEQEFVELPYEVVPASMTRPQQIRDALCNELHCTAEDSCSLVAAWHGFETWDELAAAVADATQPEGTYDEDCSAEVMSLRKETQIDILDSRFDAPPYALEAIWELLQPTSRDYRPSLRKLEDVIEEKVAMIRSNLH